MPARLRLSWDMKTWKLFLLSVLESLEFGWQVIRYALIFVWAFFRQRASLGCEMVAMRSQLTFYRESIRQKRQPRSRFHPAFRLLWLLLSQSVKDQKQSVFAGRGKARDAYSREKEELGQSAQRRLCVLKPNFEKKR